MKKFFWPAVLCLVSGCSDMTTFTPRNECDDGAVSQSDAGEYYLCSNEQWHKLDGMPLCREGDTKIEEIKNICKKFKCDEYSHWWDTNEFGENSCRNINGELVGGECINGFIQCDENQQLNVCIAGEYNKISKDIADCSCDASDPCVNAESGVGVFCGRNGVKQTCTGNENKGVSCEGDGTSGTCGECLNGDVRCENGNQICENGKYRSCRGDECSACELLCHEAGGKKCKDKNVVMICQNEQWIDDVRCLPGQTCENGSCVGEIKLECFPDGGQRCAEKDGTQHVERCYGGRWEWHESCGTGKTCANGECVGEIKPECQIGDKPRCSVDGGIQHVETCNGGRWEWHESCGTGQTCENGSCVGEIKPECQIGDKPRCSVDGGIQHVETCNGGRWEWQEECKNGCDNNLGQCNPEPDICHGRGNGELCDGNEVVICRDGKVDERLEKVENKFCKNGKFICEAGYALKGNTCVQLENYCSTDDAFECIDSGYTICINHVLNTVNCLEPSTCNQEKRCCVTADGTCTVSSECTDDNGIRYIVNGEERKYSCGFGAVCEKKDGVAKCVENCDKYLNDSDCGIKYYNNKYIGLCTNNIEGIENSGNGENVRRPLVMGNIDYIIDAVKTDDYISMLKGYYFPNDNDEWTEIMNIIEGGLNEGKWVEALYKQGDTANNNVYRILYEFVERAYLEWIGMGNKNNIGYIGQCRTDADGVVGYKFAFFEKYRKNMSVFYNEYKACLNNEKNNDSDFVDCLLAKKDSIRVTLDEDILNWLEGKDLRFKDKDDARGPVFKMFDVVHDDKKRVVVEELFPKVCQNNCNYFETIMIGMAAYGKGFINILNLLHTVLFEYYRDNANEQNIVEKCENGCRMGYCLKECTTPGVEQPLINGFFEVCSEDGIENIVEKTL